MKWTQIKLLPSEIFLTFKRFIILGKVHTQCTRDDHWLVNGPPKVTKTLCHIEIYSKTSTCFEITGAMLSNLIDVSSQSVVYYCNENHMCKSNPFIWQLGHQFSWVVWNEVVATDDGRVINWLNNRRKTCIMIPSFANEVCFAQKTHIASQLVFVRLWKWNVEEE